MKYVIRILFGAIVVYYFIFKEKNTTADIMIGTTIIIEISISYYILHKFDKGELILQSPTANIRNRIKSRMNNEKYSGLEELFLDMVSQERETKYLSWLKKE